MALLQAALSSFMVWSVIVLILALCKGMGIKNRQEPAEETNTPAATATTANAATENGNTPAPQAYENRLAIVICAHDEENVIDNLLECLEKQEYTPSKRKIFVFADHCSDSTVAKASAHKEVTVWERTSGERSSKGAVLNWGLNRILEQYGQDLDGILFFDADNLIRPSFLQQVNRAFNNGATVVTGKRKAQNPYDSVVSQWYTLYWCVINSLYNKPRNILGLTSMLSGTGFGFKLELLKGQGWQTYSLSEDIEFSTQQALSGHKVTYLEQAPFYDEQPTRLGVMWTQLSRWCTGDFQIARRYFRPWLTSFLTSPSWLLFDLFMAISFCVAFGLTALVYILTAIEVTLNARLLYFVGFGAVAYIITATVGLLAAYFDGWPIGGLWKGIITFPVFYTLFSLISLHAMVKPQKRWVSIEHKGSKLHF